jgi:hypothetical protein
MSTRREAAITKVRQAEGGSAGGTGPHGRYQGSFSRRRFPMEPRDDKRDQQQAPEQPEQPKKKRFRLVRLEERIAPSTSGGYAGATRTCQGGGSTVNI